MMTSNPKTINILLVSLRSALGAFILALSCSALAEESATETMESEAAPAVTESEAAPAMAEPTAASSYECTHNKLIRRIEVSYKSAPAKVPCEVIYTKDSEEPGVAQTLWQADNSEGYCEEKAKAFSEKLEGWGWNCN